jgi:NAD(P)-dependent dehydrogenase (short-subunit alcohol dehydrogenase family)
MSQKASALIIGAGDATGGAIARRFAREGFIACVVRRHRDKLAPLVAEIEEQGGEARAFGVDAREEEQVVALFDEIERDIAPLEIVVFNIGANVNFPIRDTTARVYRKVWEMACFAGFLTGREAARKMAPRRRGAIIFTGASASLRGRSGFAAFSSAKHGLRSLAQSRAKELGPEGVHVAHVVIDGAIDTAWIRENFPERAALKSQDGILEPDAIAENYWMLYKQPRSAWTHELDLRPWTEAW